MIQNEEKVARAIFSPKMVYDGKLLPAAFELRSSIAESYISVLRTSVSSWQDDMLLIPQRKNRTLYGYALLEVGQVRSIDLKDVVYDVKECDNNVLKSHSGIFVSYKGEMIVGGKPLATLREGVPEDFMLLAIRQSLVDIAQRQLIKV